MLIEYDWVKLWMHGDIRYIKIVQDMKRQRESLLHFQKKKVFFIQHSLGWRLKRRINSLNRRHSSSFSIWFLSCSVADLGYIFSDCEHFESAERFRAARCQSPTYSKLVWDCFSFMPCSDRDTSRNGFFRKRFIIGCSCLALVVACSLISLSTVALIFGQTLTELDELPGNVIN